MNANVIEVKPFNITKIELVALRGPKGETGYPTPEQVQTAVDAWLEDHPEATTTVQDGAITTAKLHDGAVTEDKLSESLQSLLITDTASGSIASFSDGSDGINVRELSVNVEPVQDLHGYSNPWPAGGGKNLLDADGMTAGILNSSGQIDVQNVTVNSKGNGAVAWTSTGTWRGVTTDFIAVQGGSAYRISLTETVSYVLYAWYDQNKGFISRSSFSGSSMQSVTAPNNAYYVRFTFQESAAGTYSYTKMQLESGSSATAYAPYSNICPITGWENVKVTREPWNLMPSPVAQTQTSGGITVTCDGKGRYTVSGTASGDVKIFMDLPSSFVIPVSIFNGGKGCMYLFNSAANNNFAIGFYNVNTLVDSWTCSTVNRSTSSYGGQGGKTVTRIMIRVNNTTVNATVSPMFTNDGSTSSQFVENNGGSATVTIPLGSTVYGGTLDVTTGVLTVDRAMMDLGTLTWTYNNTSYSFGFFNSSSISSRKVGRLLNALCSRYAVITGNRSNLLNGQISSFNETNANAVCVRDEAYTDAATFKTAMNGVKLVYELATPVTVQLTAQQMTTLLGQNNIFADAGDVDVTYVADTKKYIAKMIANALNS